jgi:hypothetical protein
VTARLREGRLLAVIVLAASFAVTDGLSAQDHRFHVGVAGTRATNNETEADNRQAGFGASAVARFAGRSWGVEGEVDVRSLSPAEDGSLESLSIRGGAVRGHYAVWRDLRVELGLETRTVDPEFAAQDVAGVLVGLRYEVPLASIASLSIRGAAIPLSWFNGGGQGGIGAAVGLGARARPTGGRWGLFADYDFRRLDREVQGLSVPIQFESVRIGFEWGLF